MPSPYGALHHAVGIIYRVCCLAGSASLIDDIRADLRAEGVPSAIRRHDTAILFDWLMAALSYQGISDRVAADYMEQHGRATWRDIEAKLGHGVSCPKLQSYWHFYGCRYDKLSRTCAEPDHIDHCPVPSHDLRNGRLNQTAYSLYLFVRDIAAGDLVGWIDRQFREADRPDDADRPARLRAALIEPLREVYGVSDKVLTMTLSCILLAAPRGYETWQEVGASMIAIDTLVHNFLHRTGILARFNAEHAYGAACYRPGGCDPDQIPIADVLTIYLTDIVPNHSRPKETKGRITRLDSFFGDRMLSYVTGETCRAYVAQRSSDAAGRRELEDLRAAINHHRREGLCNKVVEVVLPPERPPRDRWLTRSEAARLIWSAWRYREVQKGRQTDRQSRQHVARFILVALYTGTRASAVCGAALQAIVGHGWVDLSRGVFYRRAAGHRETKKRQPPVPLPDQLLAHLRRWKRRGQRFAVE